MSHIDLYSSSSNLGDNLALTPLCSILSCVVHLYDEPSPHSVGPIFDGIAEVVYDNGSPTAGSPKTSDDPTLPGPPSARLLAKHGYAGLVSAIPKIRLTAEEIAEAKEWASRFHNPSILKAAPQELNVRTPPREALEQIVRDHPEIDYLTFGLSKAHPKCFTAHVPIPGVIEFFDFPIRQMAAIFHAVGRYVGPDTGDYHLMLAVGGQCNVFVPPSSWHYNHATAHYREIDWCGEAPRVTYIPFP